MEMIRVRDVRKEFGELGVLKGISFSLHEGEVLSIIGPSGSGKSTLLRCLTQLEQIDGGSIEVCDDVMVTTDDQGNVRYSDNKTLQVIRLKLGLVFQSFNLFPHMSVLRNIVEAQTHVLKRSKEEAIEVARKLLGKMGLSEKRTPTLPAFGGQQQRVSIARASR